MELQFTAGAKPLVPRLQAPSADSPCPVPTALPLRPVPDRAVLHRAVPLRPAPHRVRHNVQDFRQSVYDIPLSPSANAVPDNSPAETLTRPSNLPAEEASGVPHSQAADGEASVATVAAADRVQSPSASNKVAAATSRATAQCVSGMDVRQSMYDSANQPRACASTNDQQESCASAASTTWSSHPDAAANSNLADRASASCNPDLADRASTSCNPDENVKSLCQQHCHLRADDHPQRKEDDSWRRLQAVANEPAHADSHQGVVPVSPSAQNGWDVDEVMANADASQTNGPCDRSEDVTCAQSVSSLDSNQEAALWDLVNEEPYQCGLSADRLYCNTSSSRRFGRQQPANTSPLQSSQQSHQSGQQYSHQSSQQFSRQPSQQKSHICIADARMQNSRPSSASSAIHVSASHITQQQQGHWSTPLSEVQMQQQGRPEGEGQQAQVYSAQSTDIGAAHYAPQKLKHVRPRNDTIHLHAEELLEKCWPCSQLLHKIWQAANCLTHAFLPRLL